MNATRRPFLAFLLLACFLRVLAPEAWILALHQHAHTVEEPAHTAAFAHKGKALLTAKHQHCGVEQFYDGAFQVAALVAVPTRPAARAYAPLRVPSAGGRAVGRAHGAAAPRGPPCRA